MRPKGSNSNWYQTIPFIFPIIRFISAPCFLWFCWFRSWKSFKPFNLLHFVPKSSLFDRVNYFPGIVTIWSKYSVVLLNFDLNLSLLKMWISFHLKWTMLLKISLARKDENKNDMHFQMKCHANSLMTWGYLN